MTAGERFKNWIDGLALSWKDRLRGWMVSWLSLGVEAFFNILGKAASPTLTPLINKLQQTGKVPPELAPLLDEIKNPRGQFAAMLGNAAAGAAVGGAVGRILDPLLMPLAYAMNAGIHVLINPEAQLIGLWRRKEITDELFTERMHWLGWSDEALTGVKKLTNIIPQVNDLLLMAVKEAFTPEIAEKFGQYQDYPEAITEWLEKQGLSAEWGQRYWAAHWNLPGSTQGFDLMHRGAITEDELKILLRALDVMPFWRDKLIGLSWDLPNRIELRMMARYGLVDKQFLLDMLKKIGLHQDYRGVVADMMLVMGIQSDLSARYAKGWLKAEDVKAELATASLDPKVQERVYQWIVRQSSTERVVKERDLTVADIIKGVKKGTITRAEGQTLLEQMGYDAKEAKFKLDINIPEEETATEVKQKELTKSDILNAYKLGQIDEAEAVSRLVTIRFSEDDAAFLLLLTNATIEKIAEVRERDLTKADIIKGVKLGVITSEDGYIMLLTIGYSSSEADFILAISPTATAGSPNTYNEFLAVTQSYRASQRLSTTTVTTDIIEAERGLKATEAALRVAKEKKVSEKRLQELTLAFEQAKQKYHQLNIKGKRA